MNTTAPTIANEAFRMLEDFTRYNDVDSYTEETIKHMIMCAFYEGRADGVKTAQEIYNKKQ